MDKAIGLVEYLTVPTGIKAADAMLKTSKIEILEAQTVCPGKYIVMISGSLGAINAAIEVGKKEFKEQVLDSFILGNPSESIFGAIDGTVEVLKEGAIGIIETSTAASIIVAADIAAKTAIVSLIEIRIAKGMCGKSYLMLSGEIAAVEAAVQAVEEKQKHLGLIIDTQILANPDRKLWDKLI